MPPAATDRIAPLRHFVHGFTALVESAADEGVLLAGGRPMLAELVSDDGWLPAEYATSRSDGYAQYLLHRDPGDRFSIVSFVWGPGQRTPVHNHTVWGLVGVLRGAEEAQQYELRDGLPVATGERQVMGRGDVDAVSPALGDWHRVANNSEDVSISIHVYGGDVGSLRRLKLDETSGRLVDFVSGYTNGTAAGPPIP